MKSSKVTAQICIGIAFFAFIAMFFFSDQNNLKFWYDTSLAIFGSALLSSVVAHLAYKNQVRDIKIELFSELMNGYRAYANYFNSISGGIPDLDSSYSESHKALDYFFDKYSIYTAMLGSSKGIIDPMFNAANQLRQLNGEAVLLTKSEPPSSEYWNQRKIFEDSFDKLEKTLIKTGKIFISKSFGINSTHSMDV